jgi:hypothetical protein
VYYTNVSNANESDASSPTVSQNYVSVDPVLIVYIAVAVLFVSLIQSRRSSIHGNHDACGVSPHLVMVAL